MKNRIISVLLLAAMMLTTLMSMATAAEVEATHPFTDVPKWATAVVNKIYAEEIMTGTSATTFDSNGTLTREQLATTLYRMSGSTATSTADEVKGIFTDGAKVSSWAINAVKWASENGVTTGIKDGDKVKFDPKAAVTKEQAATFIMRFVDLMKINAPTTDTKAELKDLNKVANFAKDAVSRSVAAGIITGDGNGYFKPKANTKRIEAAAMLARIPEAVKKKPVSQDPNDPNPENIGTMVYGDYTFAEDIKISKAITITDGTSKNTFTATGTGVHGWHESRVVRTEYGTYVVFAQDDRLGEVYPAAYSGYNAAVWGKFYLVKITDKGFTKVLEGEYPVHAGSCAPNVLAGEDGMIYITTFSDDKDTYYGSLVDAGTPSAHFTAEAAFLAVYEFDTKTDELVASGKDVIPFDLIGVHGYGYYQPILDTAKGKVYALFTGGEVPGYLSWFIYDLKTHTWEKENYVVETKHRSAYFHAYPDGKGGIFFVAQGIPPTSAVEREYGNVFQFSNAGYLWHSLFIFKIGNMYEEKVEIVQTIHDPDYLDREDFPQVGMSGGVPVIEVSSAAHYNGGTSYLASNGYLYVVYKYAIPTGMAYMYAIYDTNNNFKVVRSNKALQLMNTTSDKISNSMYQFSFAESMDGDMYLIAIETNTTDAMFEIYKLDIKASKITIPMITDSNGKTAAVKIQYDGSVKNIHHDRLSVTGTRSGSIQDNVLGLISYTGEVYPNRKTTLAEAGFDAADYGTVNHSGPSVYELYYYAIEFPE